jgi:hypothetical protein
MHMTRIVAGALLGALALAFTPGGVRAAPESPRPHPLYDDGGTLDWSKKLAEAQKVAKERRRLIFIEYGRES